MTPKEKIAKILSQKNYSVVKGRVHRYDVLDDKFKPVPVSGNRIPLVRDGSVVEIFNMNDVLSVIDGLNGAAKNDVPVKNIPFVNDLPFSIDDLNLHPAGIEQYGQVAIGKSAKPDHKASLLFQENLNTAKSMMDARKNKRSTKPKKASVKKPKKKAAKKKVNAQLRSKEINYIRDNYLSISINKMAIKSGVGRLTVGYIVKQIKAGKKLKYENI